MCGQIDGCKSYESSVNDLKTWFRSRKYMVEVFTVLPACPEVIFTAQAVAQVAQLGG